MTVQEWDTAGAAFVIGMFVGVLILAFVTMFNTVGDVIDVDGRNFVNIVVDGKQWFEFNPDQPVTFTKVAETP